MRLHKNKKLCKVMRTRTVLCLVKYTFLFCSIVFTSLMMYRINCMNACGGVGWGRWEQGGSSNKLFRTCAVFHCKKKYSTKYVQIKSDKGVIIFYRWYHFPSLLMPYKECSWGKQIDSKITNHDMKQMFPLSEWHNRNIHSLLSGSFSP